MTIAAVVYCLAALPPTLVQIGLAAGAPWGHLTLGGKWPGQLPPRIRAVTAIQALLLITMMTVALDSAGLVPLGWPEVALWITLIITYLSTLANLATPSPRERLYWGPLTLIMSGAITWIAFL